MKEANIYLTRINDLRERIADARALANITYNSLVNDDMQINKNYERVLGLLEVFLTDIEAENKRLTESLRKVLDTWKGETQ